MDKAEIVFEKYAGFGTKFMEGFKSFGGKLSKWKASGTDKGKKILETGKNKLKSLFGKTEKAGVEGKTGGKVLKENAEATAGKTTAATEGEKAVVKEEKAVVKEETASTHTPEPTPTPTPNTGNTVAETAEKTKIWPIVATGAGGLGVGVGGTALIMHKNKNKDKKNNLG